MSSDLNISNQFDNACKKLTGMNAMDSIIITCICDNGTVKLEAATRRMFKEPCDLTTDINDEEMITYNWKCYGEAVKNSDSVLHLSISRESRRGGANISNECLVFDCLRTFFDRARCNKSIRSLNLNLSLSTKVPPEQFQFLFENNQRLIVLVLNCEESENVTSNEYSIHVSKMLEKKNNIENIYLSGHHVDDESFDRILTAGKEANAIRVECNKEFNYICIFRALSRPQTQWKRLVLKMNSIQGVNIEDIQASLAQTLALNEHLIRLTIIGDNSLRPFCGDVTVDSFRKLLCNKTSLRSVIESNHTIEILDGPDNSNGNDVKEKCSELLNLNKMPHKQKVVQHKIMEHYFVDIKKVSDIKEMKLNVIPQVLAIEVERKLTAVYNILKSFPALCDISER